MESMSAYYDYLNKLSNYYGYLKQRELLKKIIMHVKNIGNLRDALYRSGNFNSFYAAIEQSNILPDFLSILIFDNNVKIILHRDIKNLISLDIYKKNIENFFIMEYITFQLSVIEIDEKNLFIDLARKIVVTREEVEKEENQNIIKVIKEERDAIAIIEVCHKFYLFDRYGE